MANKLLISIVGPTGVGKTAVALQLAESLGTEIISADSRQIYQELNIGTAKPTESELKVSRHHFINSHSIHQDFDAGQFAEEVDILLKQLFTKYPVVILVGGSGLYFKGVWEGFDTIPKDKEVREELVKQLESEGLEPLLIELETKDPGYFKEVDRYNKQRIIRALEVVRVSGRPYSEFRKNSVRTNKGYIDLKIGLETSRDVLYQKLDKRMDQMISAGLFDEARELFQFRNLNALQTVGYTEIFGYLEKRYDYEEAVRLLKRNTRRYAKRQLTWFRRYSDISWFDPEETEKIRNFVNTEMG